MVTVFKQTTHIPMVASSLAPTCLTDSQSLYMSLITGINLHRRCVCLPTEINRLVKVWLPTELNCVAEARATYTTKLAWQMHALPTQPTECSARKCSLDKTHRKAARRRGVVCNYLSGQVIRAVQMHKHTALT